MHVNYKFVWLKAYRRARAAESTGWNSYSIHDFETIKKRTAVRHAAQKDAARKLGQPGPDYIDFVVAIEQHRDRLRRHRGDTSQYSPHQGARECRRRVRKGMNLGL